MIPMTHPTLNYECARNSPSEERDSRDDFNVKLIRRTRGCYAKGGDSRKKGGALDKFLKNHLENSQYRILVKT